MPSVREWSVKRLARTVALLLCGVAVLGMTGCETSRHRPSPHSRADSSSIATRNNAASLLYQLLGDESNVSKLLIVKRDRRELNELIKKVSSSCGDARERIEHLGRADHTLDLTQTSLPSGEQATREAVAKTRTRELLHASGAEFEFALLLTQAEALSYAQHLAGVAATHSPTAAGREVFGTISQRMETLHGEVTALLKQPRP